NGAFTSNGHNFIGNNMDTPDFIAGNPNAKGDIVGTDAAPINPLISTLANFGGPTLTRALLPGSPALDAGDNCVADVAHCGDATIAQLTTDQRGAGFSRMVDSGDANNTDAVDIGAFE